MGLRYSKYLDPTEKGVVIYGCKNCCTHLSVSNQVISGNFTGKHGNALLMNKVVNIVESGLESRGMLTGQYLVRDILCHQCGEVVGWKYCKSEDRQQRYKEGKFILEVNQMVQVK